MEAEAILNLKESKEVNSGIMIDQEFEPILSDNKADYAEPKIDKEKLSFLQKYKRQLIITTLTFGLILIFMLWVKLRIDIGKLAYNFGAHDISFSLLSNNRNDENFDSHAALYLGHMYSDIENIKNVEEAAKLYHQSAELGNEYGQRFFGFVLEYGIGVSENKEEAVKWYRKSAEQGNYMEQLHLGDLYKKGSIVKQNYVEAVKWYRKLAEQGVQFGQFNLAVMYEEGLGVPKDISESVRLYRLAAKQGNKNAKDNLKRLGYSE